MLCSFVEMASGQRRALWHVLRSVSEPCQHLPEKYQAQVSVSTPRSGATMARPAYLRLRSQRMRVDWRKEVDKCVERLWSDSIPAALTVFPHFFGAFLGKSRCQAYRTLPAWTYTPIENGGFLCNERRRPHHHRDFYYRTGQEGYSCSLSSAAQVSVEFYRKIDNAMHRSSCDKDNDSRAIIPV